MTVEVVELVFWERAFEAEESVAKNADPCEDLKLFREATTLGLICVSEHRFLLYLYCLYQGDKMITAASDVSWRVAH